MIKKTLFTITLLLLLPPITKASFNNLTKITVYKDNPSLTLKYNSQTSKLIQEALGDPEWEEGTVRLVQTKIHSNKPQDHIIQFNPGPNKDTVFEIYLKSDHTMELLGTIYAKNLTIPGNGFLYSSGHSGIPAGKGRKYSIQNNKVVEIK